MKVALLADDLGNGGAERQLTLLATNLAIEHDVRVWALGDGVFAAQLRAGGVSVQIYSRLAKYDVSVGLRLASQLAAWRPDVVHSWGWISTAVAMPYCRLTRTPLIDGSIRTASLPQNLTTLKRLLVSRADAVVSNTSAGIASWRVPRRRALVIANGFDTRRLSLVEAAPHDENTCAVVMVGRMAPAKHFDLVIDVARELSAERHGWRFMLVGRGADESRLKAAAADLIAARSVTFIDGGEEVLGIVGSADIGLLMTNPEFAQEGFSNAIMEYMACGLPVVCGESGGNRELVDDGVTGLIVRSADQAALAAALRRLRGDRGYRLRLGAAGRAKVLNELTVAAMTQRYVALYDDVVRRRGPRSAREPVGGGGPRILMLAPHLTTRGPLRTLVPLLAEELRRRGCHVRGAPWSRRRDGESASLKLAGRLYDLSRIMAKLAFGRYDALFVPTALTWSGVVRDVPLLFLSRFVCPHRIVHFHGGEADRLTARGHRGFKWWARRLAVGCDAILVLSREEREAWRAFAAQVSCRVVRNPYVSRATVSGHDHQGSGRPLAIVFVGRLVREKGVYELIGAVRELVAAGLELRVSIVGEGDESEGLRAEIARGGLDGTVELAGYLHGGELEKAYAAADIFVLPTYAEGFPMVVLEAMDAGLPIVTTPLRGAVDHLCEGENVLYCRPRDTGDLARALRQLGEAPLMRAAMGRANREKVHQFAPATVIDDYFQVIGDVVYGDDRHER